MTEKLLHYIWKLQLFNKQCLTTNDDEPIEIIFPGVHNHHQGPDFIDARVKINNTIWAGNIELHSLSSHWDSHKHSNDKNYKNVILHVVWKHDSNNAYPFPTLILQNRVSKFLLNQYEEWMNRKSFIACENSIASIDSLIWSSWKERLLIERWENKFKIIEEYLVQSNNHWEEIFWWMIAKNFGIKINDDAFLSIAQSVSINILAKHKNQIHQLESILFGQAGLLNGKFEDDYPNMLRKEYNFLKKKYKLYQPTINLFFLRMRPANFPTIRLAQLSMLIHKSSHLFSKIKESNSLEEIMTLLEVTANDYWHYHYQFDETSTFKEKKLGVQMIENILINSILPILFAYGHFNKENLYKEKAMAWLQQIKAEQNNITKRFQFYSVENKNALDSQALIQLKNEYCNNKRCLECAIGNKILKTI